MAASKIGRYEIKGELGRGGMATVYLAHDPVFGREVAVKVLPRELLHSPNFRARFEREARTIASLEHPAIVPVHDYGEEDGQPYIVMRLMRGGSLAERLRPGALTLPEAARILSALAPALDRAHARGIIHRDLKPSNILFDEDNHPHLADFGIARLTELDTSLGTVGPIGTPAYMSPEQASGEKNVDARSDLYALGVIVFQMLTGQLPYDANTPLGLAMKHVNAPLPRARDLRPDLPPSVEHILQRALAKSPAARYPDAANLAQDLATLPASGPPSQGPQPDPAPGPSPDPDPAGLTRLFDYLRARRGLLAVLLLMAGVPVGLAALALAGLLARAILQPPPATPSATLRVQAATPPAANTRPPVTPAPTLAPATAGPTASSTPSLTPTPSSTPTLIPTPTGPPPIGPENAAQLELLGVLEPGSEVFALAFSPDSALLAAATLSGTVHLWDTVTWEAAQMLAGHTDWARHVAFSPDGRTLASASYDTTVRLWAVDSGQPLRVLEGHTAQVRSVSFSADSLTLASAGGDSGIRLWEAETGQLLRVLEGHTNVARAVFSPNANTLASGSYDHTVRVWDPASGETRRLLTGHTDEVRYLAFSPDGRTLVSASLDGALRFWDVDSGQALDVIDTGTPLVGVAFSPDGRLLASAGGETNFALWDVGSLQLLRMLEGHTSLAQAVAFSPDGRLLATGGNDKTVRLWQAPAP